MGDLEDRPDTCGFRVLTATSSSAAIGTVAGAVVANWAVSDASELRGLTKCGPDAFCACNLYLHHSEESRIAALRSEYRLCSVRSVCACASSSGFCVLVLVQDVPKVLKGKALPALVATGRVMGVYGATFAAIGAAFSAVDVRLPP